MGPIMSLARAFAAAMTLVRSDRWTTRIPFRQFDGGSKRI